jgi:hypothetical protein
MEFIGLESFDFGRSDESGDDGNGQSIQSSNEDCPLGIQSFIVQAEEQTESWKSKNDGTKPLLTKGLRPPSFSPDDNVETNQKVARDINR